jgi:hypothetical protein
LNEATLAPIKALNDSSVQQCLKQIGTNFMVKFFSMFYVMSPSATTFNKAEDVPNFEAAVSDFYGLINKIFIKINRFCFSWRL